MAKRIIRTLLILRWLYLSLLLGGTILGAGYFLAYRPLLGYEMPLNRSIGFVINGLEATEHSDSIAFRWTSPQNDFRFPPLGQSPYRLHLLFHTPLTTTARTLDVICSDQLVGRVKVFPGWQTVTLLLPPTTTAPILKLLIDPPLHAQGRVLGVALVRLRLDQIKPTVLPLAVLRQLLMSMILIIIIMLIVGARQQTVMVTCGILITSLLLSLAWQRFNTLLLLTPLTQALVVALCPALIFRWLSQHWLRGQARRWLVGVQLIGVSLFVIHCVGMWYPNFHEVDHTLRIHQIQRIASGNQQGVEAQLNNQFEWGNTVQVPYSLWAYYPFVPLAHVVTTGQLKLIVETVTTLLEASIPLMLFSIITSAGESASAGWWAAASYAVLPIGYLYYHDGSFPTIIGLWMTVVMLVCLQRLALQPSWQWCLLSSVVMATSMLLYVTQLGFVPLLVGGYVITLWVFGGSKQRVIAKWSAGALSCGIVLALALYYGSVLPKMLLTTVPMFWSTLRAGGSVGNLYPALSGSFLMQAWGHFRVIGLILPAAGVIFEFRRRRWLGYLGLAYAGFVVLTVFVDMRFHLWNKHLYFALPGVALMAGCASARLERSGKAGSWLARSILLLLLIASLHAWVTRVLFFASSLRTL